MDTMDITELQKETLASVNEYLTNLIPAMNKVIIELSGNEKEDTWEYLRMIIDGLNWVIEAYNGTSSYINKDSSKIDSAVVDASVKKLSLAYRNKDNGALSSVLAEDIIPFLTTLKSITEAI